MKSKRKALIWAGASFGGAWMADAPHDCASSWNHNGLLLSLFGSCNPKVDEEKIMKLSVFCGVSVDGFLARPNGAFDFLDAGGREPHGFDEFYSSVDVVVIGRKTFEVVLTFGKWFYGTKPVVVLSSDPLDFSSIHDGVVEQMSGEPANIVMRLKARGFQHAYIDGGITIQRFLAARLIDRLVITRVPVLIGVGIPLFGPLLHDISLRHIATRTYEGGLVQTEYEISAEGPQPSGPS